jgi:WD40 repeat protein
MLRVSPDGREVWVQTASGTNVVLDARTLERRHTERLGNAPVTTAWSPDGRYNFVSLAGESYVAILDPQTGKVVKRLEVGENNANSSFRPETGSTATWRSPERTRWRWWRWSRSRWRAGCARAKDPWASSCSKGGDHLSVMKPYVIGAVFLLLAAYVLYTATLYFDVSGG